jgi:putative tryptophan/tyrosine transport system substrate-binding protein
MIGVADPVGAGLTRSLAHPGGNVTGTSSVAADLVGKQIELLREVAPKTSRISALWNPANVVFQRIQLRQVEAARQASNIDIHLVEARSQEEFATAFASIRKEGTDALIILGEPVFESNFSTLARLALEDRLPKGWCTEEFCSCGRSYGIRHKLF